MTIENVVDFILENATNSDLSKVASAYNERRKLLSATKMAKAKMTLRKGMRVITKNLKSGNGEIYTIVRINRKNAVCKKEGHWMEWNIPLDCIEEVTS